MIRRSFDRELGELKEELSELGKLCEEAIESAVKSFLDNDRELALSVMQMAEKIDRSEREIEGLCVKLFMRQQPVAADLRSISAALKMVTDMQRVGDQSVDISEIVCTAKLPTEAKTDDYRDMTRTVVKMVDDAVTAFVDSDVSKARSVIAYDDVADALFDKIKQNLIERLRDQDGPAEYVVDLLMIAKYLERIGDHAVNIGRWVVFSVTGELEG